MASAAAGMAKANEDKGTMCKELEDVSIQIKNLEKRKEYLKSKLMPIMTAKERIGLVEKIEIRELSIDADLTAKLKQRFGDEIVKPEEIIIKKLREKMEEDEALDKSIPRKDPTYQLRVGEPFKK
jgi:hypothetical protein